jgi:hypothetical protein
MTPSQQTMVFQFKILGSEVASGPGGLVTVQTGQATAPAPQPQAYVPDHGRSGCALQTDLVSSHTKQGFDSIIVVHSPVDQ